MDCQATCRADGIHRNKHQCRGRQYQSHDHKRTHHRRIDVGHRASLPEQVSNIGVSRVARSMIRISGALDFSLDGRKRLGRVDISERSVTGNWHFDDRLGIIADQVACANVTLN